MASIVKRGRSWRAMVVRKGQRVNATFDTRSEAEEWAVRAEAAILAGQKPAQISPISGRQTVADIIARYSREVSPAKDGVRWEEIRAKALCRMPVFNVPPPSFGPSDLASWRDGRLRTVSASTVNRDLNFISAVINHAIKEWCAPFAANPVHLIQRPKNPRARKRRVSVIERAAIADALGWDRKSTPVTKMQWVAAAFYLALETAMRKGEILSLRWSNINLEKQFAYLQKTKNGDERYVPLSSDAIALLRIIGVRADEDPVIHVASGTLDQFFRRARDIAGLPDLHFHDSRREATTVFSKKLSNVLELAAVTGHRSLNVLKDYYRPDPSDLAKKLG
ncbi:site-specific integrase [Acetobacter oeni]|uniref:site-specific integrase n=1 Tax=Acetobacter oeni TaxID=304077 RepID=UPI0011BE8DF8|nr:site-specific integrase [Acetobacter oeni]MBB3883810.1 integrase [Acetobacter oeni]NHO19847.1 tyrosine-type recombinase/integrase [Acetobacter oeni]